MDGKRRYAGWFMVLCLLVFPVGVTASEYGRKAWSATENLLPRDDGSRSSLLQAVANSITALEGFDPGRQYHLCGRTFTVGELVVSLRSFLILLEQAGPAIDPAVLAREHFDLCRGGGDNGGGRLLVTGYFEPEVAASLQRTGMYHFPLYAPPADLHRVADGAGGYRVGRLVGGNLQPYWSRAEIETGDLLAGTEIVYLADPVEAFILHVQGSGRLRLPDGTVRRAEFAAANGRDYRSIGRLLVEEGKLDLAEVTLERIRRYLEDHPEDRQRILHSNERYIFFRLAGNGEEPENLDHGPTGSLGVPVTPGRTVALDDRLYPSGILAFLSSRQPRLDDRGRVVGWQPLRRLVVHQDSGTAIKGANRLDLFWGSGALAGAAAGVMKNPGEMVLLLPRLTTQQ